MKGAVWFAAGVATGIAAAVLAVPIWHALAPPHTSLPTAATPAAAPARPAPSLDAAAAGLAQRLKEKGGSRDEWLLLARSYEFMGRTAEAQKARESAEMADLATLVPAQPIVGPGTVSISGTVTIDPKLAAKVGANSTLFVYAKAADSAGPPLAVMRTRASQWPVSFHLDDSMAMVPTRKLSQFQHVIVEARISSSGQAMPSPGDLYVTSESFEPSSGRTLVLTINREIT